MFYKMIEVSQKGTFSEALKFLVKIERLQEKVDYQINYFVYRRYRQFFCREALYRNHIFIVNTKLCHEICDILVKTFCINFGGVSMCNRRIN